MIKRRWVHVVSALGLVIGSAVTSIAVTSPDSGRAAAAAALGAGGEYHALAPARVLDTRSRYQRPDVARRQGAHPGCRAGVRGPTARPGWPAGAGRRGDVLAVAVNITVVSPTDQGYLRVFGKGAHRGDSSLVNFKAGQNVPNMAIVRPGADGKIVDPSDLRGCSRVGPRADRRVRLVLDEQPDRDAWCAADPGRARTRLRHPQSAVRRQAGRGAADRDGADPRRRLAATPPSPTSSPTPQRRRRARQRHRRQQSAGQPADVRVRHARDAGQRRSGRRPATSTCAPGRSSPTW